MLDLIDRRSGRLFALMAAVAFAVLLYLGRNGTFYHDEWTFIGQRGGTLTDWFGPHNEHWSTVPFFVYRVLLLTVGLTTYLPYLAVLLALHVVAAGALFGLIRQASGALVALAAAAIFLFMGNGEQNLFWAFQIAFLGSAAGGFGALLALATGHPRIAMGLLVVAIASSSMGLPFVAAAGAMLLLDSRRRRQIVWLVPVAAVFLVWFALIVRYSASRLSAFTFLTPLFGVAAGHLVLGEPITSAFAAAVALVAAGLLLVNWLR